MALRPSFEASTEVTQGAPGVEVPRPRGREKKAGHGQLVPFTRHPTMVSKALLSLAALRLSRKSDHLVASTMIQGCDKEGIIWAKPRQLAATLGLALNTVLASLRRLRDEGLIVWQRVHPTKRLPKRLSYRLPVQLGRGKRTTSGCRLYVVQWQRLGVSWAPRDLAQELRDRSNLDRSGSIHLDRSSDLLDLPSGALKLDCAAVAAGAPPPDGGTETRNAAGVHDDRPGSSRGGLVAIHAAPDAISRPAVSSAAPAPAARAPRPSAAIARAGGQGAPESSDAGAPDGSAVAPVTAAEMRASLAFLYGPRPPSGPAKT